VRTVEKAPALPMARTEDGADVRDFEAKTAAKPVEGGRTPNIAHRRETTVLGFDYGVCQVHSCRGLGEIGARVARGLLIVHECCLLPEDSRSFLDSEPDRGAE
jgi:hypothetical protein